MSSGNKSTSAVSLKFGTDGVRGIANLELTAEWAVGLGKVAAKVLGDRPRFVLGRDTRISGEMLAAAISAGIASAGLDVLDLGVVTTPGVAWASRTLDVPGVVISASHNVFSDNGVKFFAAGGNKLSDSQQADIERLLEDPTREELIFHETHREHCGRIHPETQLVEGYRDFLVSSIDRTNPRLGELSVVVDCANGAAYKIAPDVFSQLGIQLHVIGDSPNGTNINDGYGSTNLSELSSQVIGHGATLGVAFDGDGDRCLAVDESGDLVDGDQMMAMFARDLLDRGRLAENTVVVTSMANLGLRKSMGEIGVEVRETDVGDRFVLIEMDRTKACLGGEQSGHLIFRDLATTGDGLLTALKLIELVARKGTGLKELADQSMTRLPQSLISVVVEDPRKVLESSVVDEYTAKVRHELGNSGRVVIRPSGTEPKVRVMVEAQDQDSANHFANILAEVISREIGAKSTPGISG